MVVCMYVYAKGVSPSNREPLIASKGESPVPMELASRTSISVAFAEITRSSFTSRVTP